MLPGLEAAVTGRMGDGSNSLDQGQFIMAGNQVPPFFF